MRNSHASHASGSHSSHASEKEIGKKQEEAEEATNSQFKTHALYLRFASDADLRIGRC
jgi:hypothetical protein